MYANYIKRIIDVIASVTLILILCPFMIVIAIAIVIFQGRPIIFTQERLGENHVTFKIIKFCTMTSAVDAAGTLLPDKDRMTRTGSFLRKSSLDELPSLLNVLRGEMSIVGPRPLPKHYKKRYSTKQDRRHEVRPGVTGWAQVNGRNAIPWEEKFRLDVWYVDNQAFFLDLKILILTINRVLLKKDIIPSDKDAMEEFLGTKK
jgi:sugar transferase EpsL